MKNFTILNNKNIHAHITTVTQLVFANDEDVVDFYPLDRDSFFEHLIQNPFSYKFKKFSNLHWFLYCIEDTLLYESARRDCKNAFFYEDEYVNTLDAYGEIYSIDTPGCKNWITKRGTSLGDAYEEDIRDYYDHLNENGIYQQILIKLVEEAFYILFTNMSFLFEFNKLISTYLKRNLSIDLSPDVRSKFRKSGGILRSSIPKWVERAIYFRDRGRCRNCNKDLSGILSMQNLQQIDHIIPLQKYGMNCITNLQLMCDDCNNKKGIKIIAPSIEFESWY